MATSLQLRFSFHLQTQKLLCLSQDVFSSPPPPPPPEASGSGSAPASFTGQQDEAQPTTSGGLKDDTPRKRIGIQKAKEFIDKILANSPAFNNLDDAKQDLALVEIDSLLNGNIEGFMGPIAPLTLYPYEQALLNVVNNVFQYNEDVFGIKWTDDMFKIPEDIQEATQDAEGSDDADDTEDDIY
ncbi:hypothetical protein PG994_008143 [Apiospora phragmitis]|uniref:Uncharacterized protein n=1 Tax=Apiospora phragmitis TaxID=2905665 RepID=A0ABR1USW8_9PEZI